MRNGKTRLALVLLLVIALLSAMCGFAEEASEPEGMEISVDEVVASEVDEAGEAAPPELAILLYNPPSATINFGESVTLTATVAAAGEDVTWMSSDENVAEVHPNSDGSVAVVGVGEGTATITCAFGDQAQTYSVAVNPPKTLLVSDVEYPSTLRISGRGWGLGRGSIASVDELRSLTSAIQDASGELIAPTHTQTFEGGVKSFKISGIDRYVPFGKIITEGQYIWTLTATDASGRSVTVNLPIQAVMDGETVVSSAARKSAPAIQVADAESSDAIEIQVGERRSLTATQLMASDAGSGVIWVSYDPAVATVSPDGELTGVGEGSTTVVCRTLDNTGFSAGCAVKVHAAAPAAEGNAAPNPQAEAVPAPQGDGRNLLQNSTGNLGDASLWGAMEFSTEGYNGNNCLILKRAGFNEAGRMLAGNTTINDPLRAAGANADFVVSGYYYVDSSVDLDGDNNQVFVRFGGENNGENFVDTVAVKIGRDAPRDEWIRFSQALKVPDNNFVTVHFITALEKNGCIRFSQLKIERGGVATDWTPAPEDAGE